MRAVAVFSGSNFGASTAYADAVRALGGALAAAGIRLVYGGTHKGLMGVLADAVLAAGGEAQGVITERLHARGHLHPGLTGHEIVADMRARKARMAELADAFIAVPGGLGTMEEFFEAWTLVQLGDLAKPCGLLDVRGFFAPLLAFVDHMVTERFVKPEHRAMVVVEADPGALVERLRGAELPRVEKWF